MNADLLGDLRSGKLSFDQCYTYSNIIELSSENVCLSIPPESPRVPARAVCKIMSVYPQSRFHHALHISYPNAHDRERARKLGTSPGGLIEIHGIEEKGLGLVR